MIHYRPFIMTSRAKELATKRRKGGGKQSVARVEPKEKRWGRWSCKPNSMEKVEISRRGCKRFELEYCVS